MKLTLETSKLQNLVAKAVKGSSNNKMLPLTNLMCIKFADGKLTLCTTDGSNYLYVSDIATGEDFYVVVQTDLFSKLISRLTCETVSLELKDEKLTVVGNGFYIIDLPLDEEGELVKYPDPVSKVDISTADTQINRSIIDLILNTAKASLATSLDIPCYTGYYMGDKILATDTFKICGINSRMFDNPALISAETMNLLDLMDDEVIGYWREGNVVVFFTDDCIVYAKVMDSIDDFQVEAISGLVEDSYSSSCVVKRNTLCQLLDRLVLFVSPYDKNEIQLTFTNSGILIKSKQDNSSELIDYYESDNFQDFTCRVDVQMFASQVKANVGDSIEIQYGKPNALKLVDGTVVQVVALSE